MQNESGFTLIEVIIALVILMFGLTGMLGMSGYAFRTASNNERWTYSRLLASNTLSQITAQPLDTLQTTFEATPSGTQTTYVKGVTYTTTWQLQRLGSASDPLRVNVTVRFPGDDPHAPVVVSSVKAFYY